MRKLMILSIALAILGAIMALSRRARASAPATGVARPKPAIVEVGGIMAVSHRAGQKSAATPTVRPKPATAGPAPAPRIVSRAQGLGQAPTRKLATAAAVVVVVAMLGLLPAGQTSASHLADGLEAYWSFDDGADPTADDAHANDGDIEGAATFSAYPNVAPNTPGNDNALSFDGTDDFVSVAHADNLDMTGAYTISVWVNVVDDSTLYRPILVRGATDENDIEVYVQKTSDDLIVVHNRGNPIVSVDPSDDVGFDWVGFADPPLDTWFHLAVVFDGTDVDAYYDGVAAAVTQNTTAMADPLDTDKGWWIGKLDHSLSGFGGVNLFKGLLDEVRIYNRALAAGEIAALADYSNFSVSLSPNADFNPAGTSHTLTATIDPALSFIPVLFEVTAGPNAGDSGTDESDGSGEATFTYPGDGYSGPGTEADTIKACLDIDDSGTCDGGEPDDTVTKTWFDVSSPAQNFCGGSVGTILEVATDSSAGVIVSSSVRAPVSGGKVGIYFLNMGPGPIAFDDPAWSVSGESVPNTTPTTIPLTPTLSGATFSDLGWGGTFGEGADFLGCVNFTDVSISAPGNKGTAHLDLWFSRGGTPYRVRVNVHFR